MLDDRTKPILAFRASRASAYVRPVSGKPIGLHLDANESPTVAPELLRDLTLPRESVGRYPDAREVERALAERAGVSSDQLIVTAGADDALNRIAMALVEPGRNVVVTTPTFEMIPIYARHAGGEVREVPWMSGPFPVDEMVAAADQQTAAVFVVSPNNPTGAAASAGDIVRLRERLNPSTVLVVDAAYEEFADAPLTPAALTLPATVVTRTFSKAFGLAGLRIGYALSGSAEMIGWLRSVGQPYAVSGVALELLGRWLDTLTAQARIVVDRTRVERGQLEICLRQLGATPIPSQANFVLCRFSDAAAVCAALTDGGIAVREFPNRPRLREWLRMTCPANADDFRRLCSALRQVVGDNATIAPKRTFTTPEAIA